MKKVLILYKFLPQYRVEFFNSLKIELEKSDIQLNLVYGKLKNSSALKKDEVELPWAVYRENKVLKINSTQLLWQPALDLIQKHDLVIVEQANSLLINYILIILRRFTNIKVAFWGHGANLQENSKSLKNRFKYLYLSQCDWWFAYTDNVKKFLMDKGVKTNQITVVQNAIDTNSLKKYYDEITDHELEALKKEMHIESEHIAIYCGALYKEKRIDFLIEASILIKSKVSDFHLIIIGAGEEAFLAEDASIKYDWIHYIGPKFGKDRVIYFKMASLFLMPGLVGLAILDAFAMQTPMITTRYPFHSPEIEYLQDRINGIITKDDINSYAENVIECFNDLVFTNKLREGCMHSAKIYTIEQMVKNFADGVKQCLSENL